jgi:hypothetical protein
MATVVGAIAGWALLAVYALSVLAGLLVGATWIGALGTRLFRRDASTSRVVLSVLAGVVALALVQAIPFVGALALVVVLLLGLGAWTVHGYRAYTARRL